MRTTVDLPDSVYRQMKSLAALRGMTVKRFITQVVERELSSSKHKNASGRVRLPLVPSRQPRSVELTSDRLAEILEEEDLHGPAGH